MYMSSSDAESCLSNSEISDTEITFDKNIIDYGRINIVSMHDKDDRTHVKIIYNGHHREKFFVEDVFNVEVLNRKLDEINEYIITGVFGGKIALLITNRGSLVSSMRYMMCRSCRHKWKRIFYTGGDICNCSDELKRESLVMHIERGKVILSPDYIDFIKKIFSERAGTRLPSCIYQRTEDEIADDIIWCESIHQFIINISQKYLLQNNFVAEYNNIIQASKAENKFLERQMEKVVIENKQIKEQINKSICECNDLHKMNDERLRKLNDFIETSNSYQNIIRVLQTENDMLRQKDKRNCVFVESQIPKPRQRICQLL